MSAKAKANADTAAASLMLNELRLPATKALWQDFATRADAEGWPAARFLSALLEHEVAERDRRRIERHMNDAHLLPGKTIASFEFEAVPMVSKAQLNALAEGDAWIGRGANVLLFGPPGGGKSHLASALGLALVEKGWRVLFTRTTDLVQRLQIARQELGLEAALAKLDKYHLLILDDIAYVAKDKGETSVLFEQNLRTPRASLPADHGEPAVRQMGRGVPGARDDGGGDRPADPPLDDLRDERRELPAADRAEGGRGGPRPASRATRKNSAGTTPSPDDPVEAPTEG